MAWTTEGVKSSPSSGTVLADTGQLGAGTYTFKFLGTSTIAVGNILIQQRNSGNSSTVMEQIVNVPVASSINLELGPITVGSDERIRVITNSGLFGSIQASLFYS